MINALRMKENSLLTARVQKRFALARAAANLSPFPRVKIGAVIIDKSGEVLAVGCNKQKSHPLQAAYNERRELDTPDIPHWIHAEIDALVKARHVNLSGGSIFVYRETRRGELAMSRPCGACMTALRDAGIRRIFYTTSHGFALEELI